MSFVFRFLVEGFWLSAKKYRHVCQNCILSLTGKIWGRRFEQLCQCLFFSDFRRQLLEIVAKYLGATLSELRCKCPEESFGKKTEENFSSLFCDGELKLFGPLAKKNRQVCKTASFFSTGTFWEKSQHYLVLFGAWTECSPNSGY